MVVKLSPVFCFFLAQELSISNVVNAVADIQRFREFAGSLPGLNSEDVDTIKQNYKIDEQNQRLIELWFKRDINPSWEKLKRVVNHRYPRVRNQIYNIMSSWQDYIVAILPTRISKFISSIQYPKKYQNYVKSLYRIQIPTQLPLEVGYSQWLPTVTHKFFKLAMIKGEKILRGEVEEEFVRLTITGKVDDILLKKCPINLEDIFKDYDDTLGKRKVILLEGAPGSGKSTLSLHICQQWGENKLFTQYSLVVLVHLRDPSVQNAKNIAELLPVECGHQCDIKREEISRIICATHGEGVLFILDGWDELPAKIKRESIFIKLIHGKISNSERFLHLSSVIITSRPVSSGDLHSLVSARIEILGFSHDELQRFVCSCLPESAESLFKLIKENHALADICSIPLNATILVHLFKCGRNTLPNSRYYIFQELILSFIYHDFMKYSNDQDNMSSSIFESLDELPTETDQKLHELCELAYQGVYTDTVTFQIRDLPPRFKTLGLLQGTEVSAKRGKTTFYNFFHLSIQEFLAARFIMKHLPHSKQLRTLNELITNPRFCGIIHFFSAMTKLTTPGVNRVILELARSCATETPQNFVTLFYCLFEAKNESVCNLVAEQLRHELNLSNITLNAASCQCLSYFLSFVHEYELSLRGCSIGNEGCNILFKGDKMYCLKSLRLVLCIALSTVYCNTMYP